jgi:FtsP/CotA-like multicopper oxidase with cupredoxin domain
MRLLILLALLLAAPVAAQREPEWRAAQEYDVLLRPWAYEPRLIRLPAGQPVRLHFVNQSRTTMAFSAPLFFRGARLRPRDADIVRRGGLRLAPGERREVALVAAPGRYGAHSANLVHRLLGMHGEILVE